MFTRKEKKNRLTSFSSFKNFETKVFSLIKYRFLVLILARVCSKDRQVVPAFRQSDPFL